MAVVTDYSIFDPAVVLANTMKALQDQADKEYQVQLGDFATAKDNWLQANTRNRDMGLAIIPFSTPIPAKTVYFIDNGVIGSNQVVDPSVKIPELPPVNPSVSTPFSTQAPAKDATVQSLLISILNCVMDIQKKVTKA